MDEELSCSRIRKLRTDTNKVISVFPLIKRTEKEFAISGKLSDLRNILKEQDGLSVLAINLVVPVSEALYRNGRLLTNEWINQVLDVHVWGRLWL